MANTTDGGGHWPSPQARNGVRFTTTLDDGGRLPRDIGNVVPRMGLRVRVPCPPLECTASHCYAKPRFVRGFSRFLGPWEPHVCRPRLGSLGRTPSHSIAAFRVLRALGIEAFRRPTCQSLTIAILTTCCRQHQRRTADEYDDITNHSRLR